MAIIQKSPRAKILATYMLDSILPLIGGRQKYSFDTAYGVFEIKLARRQLRYLKEHPVCVSCGIAGNVYLLLQNAPTRSKRPQPPSYYQPFLSMYHKDDSGNFYLITIDHIKPISLGGTYAYSNCQTMCLNCNVRKGNTYQRPESSQC